jgi:hypothetical protein
MTDAPTTPVVRPGGDREPDPDLGPKDRVVAAVRSRVRPLRDDLRHLKEEAGVRLHPRQNRGDVFDISFWGWLPGLPLHDVLAFIDRLPDAPDHEWTVDCDDEVAPSVAADECFAEHGVWPVSFSYPHAWPRFEGERSLLSTLIPGTPYSFFEEREYIDAYGHAHLGVTHRKMGWDCFRHVEILAAGSIPLMVDVAAIPRHSMVHYPQRAMREVVRRVQTEGGHPDRETLVAFHNYFGEHLTCVAMARYVLETSGFAGAERVLFVDPRLRRVPEYQSVLTLIGLKHLLGARCDVLYPVPYIYDDYPRPVGHLYGRGLGYTRKVSASARSGPEPDAGSRSVTSLLGHRRVRPADYDVVVVGSIARNGPMAHRLLDEFPAERTVWIHGEDQPPSPREMHFLRLSGTKVFVRAVPSCRTP